METLLRTSDKHMSPEHGGTVQLQLARTARVHRLPSTVFRLPAVNPLLLVIQEARGTAFWGHPLNFTHLGYLYAFGLGAYLFGAMLFQRLRGSFADVL